MTPHDLYAKMHLTPDNIRSQKASVMIAKHAVRRVLKDSGLTLDDIGRIEGDISGTETHHATIIHSLSLRPYPLLIRATALARRLYIADAPVEILLTKTQPQWRA